MNLNLCFHGVGTCDREREPGEGRYWVARDVFLRILDEARERPNVRLSFDDGNRSDVDTALPALTERGLRATFFTLAGRLHDSASLNAADLRSLRAAGMDVGNHGWAHVPWRRLSANDARREFHDARQALQDASGGEIDQAAFPLGRYDRHSVGALKRAGYRAVYTSDRFPARPRAWFQARYSVTAEDTVESVQRLFAQPPSAREARNLAVSMIKRVR